MSGISAGSPGRPQYEVVRPSRVDEAGRFVSNTLSHRVSRVKRRDVGSGRGAPARVFYRLQHEGHDLRLNLTLNPNLLAPGFLTERRYGGLEGAQIRSRDHALCHFLGEVWERRALRGPAAISTCDGLTGLFKLSDEEFFIRPLEPAQNEESPQAHMIYKRHIAQPPAPSIHPLPQGRQANGTCGVKDLRRGWARAERQRERWEGRRQKRRLRQRSVSRERWVETLVVADPKMVEYHGSAGVESYVLAVMNIVSGLFRDSSIGNAVNIVVVRLILLEKDEEDLKISHHADNSLSSFCKWQKRLNTKGDEHPAHHDVAVLLTRKDICAAINKPCETLGLSHVAGMCQPHRSCSISEDTGLPLAFTVAHELGHNFGIQHDGSGNDCEPIGKRPFIMSPQLLYGTSPPSWSRCSRQYITRFLDRGWGWCLDDAPSRDELTLRSAPPGVLYSAAHQCRLQYGSNSLLCDDMDSVCSTLWCTVADTCHSKLDGAVDGTKCGKDKWCFSGECVPKGFRQERVDGGWAPWGEWSPCPRSCGAGVQNAQRDCSSPAPKYGGKYCLGERRRYRICNREPCPSNLPSFRHVQCGHFDTMPYKGKFYKWVHVNNRVNPCELHCRPLNEYFSEKMLDAATDGTQCYEGTSSRDVCINGICKNVGCDYEIDSNAVEDRCGVCHGNGSTCETVKKTFEKSEGLGYVDIGLIPEGARDIRIEEVAEAGNFLALRSNDPDKYFLNGGWTIQWNGDYKAAGTVFTYERTGHLENLTSPGPTLEPVWIQLLFQETNPGVRYEYTISRGDAFTDSDNDIVALDFMWRYGSWTECSATCGTGVKRQIVHCVERTSGMVEEHYCDPATRPDDKRTSCNEEPCPARWWAGEWQTCSATCGDMGTARRTVLCVQSVSLEEQKALQPTECQRLPRPQAVTLCNTDLPCPSDWTAGNWSECPVTCGVGMQRRDVICMQNTRADCDPKKRPNSEKPCQAEDCPKLDDFVTEWSGSGSSSREVFSDINSIPVSNRLPKPGPGTTRAHPSPRGRGGDPNDILGRDFSQHNHIVQPGDNHIDSSNNVQVDDFYYDYNFIKFHEDLSYDFGLGFEKGGGGERNDVGGGRGPGPEGKSNPAVITVKTDPEERTTDPPAVTSRLPTAAPTTPQSGRDEGPKTSAVLPTGPAEEQVDIPRENPTKFQIENEEDEFDSEDYFLLVSTASTPASRIATTTFSPGWKDSNANVDLTLDQRTVSVPTETGPSKDVSGSSNMEEPEAGLSHDATGRIFTGEAKADSEGMESQYEDADGDLMESPISHDHAPGEFPKGLIGGEWVDVHDVTIHVHSPSRSEIEHGDENTHSNSQDNWGRTVTSDGAVLDSVMFHTETDEEGLAEPETPTTAAEPTHEGLPSDKPDQNNAKESTAKEADTRRLKWIIEHTVHRDTSGPFSLDPSDPAAGDQVPSSSWAAAETPSPTDLEDLPPPATTAWSEQAATLPVHPTLIETATSETAGPGPGEASPHTPSSLWSEIDFNEILVPTELRPPGTNPPVTDQPTQEGDEGPDPDWLLEQDPTPPVQPDTSAFWMAERWSGCSTTCGLGAIWRQVRCSTGNDSDCDASERPPPARRCYLRPCSAWMVGEWGKCTNNCGGGVKFREVQCYDTRDRRPLRPFHCQPIALRPAGRMSCNPQPCLDWYSSSWGECSELCGGGEQQRLVTCPEPEKCDDSLRLDSIQACNTQPCAQWVTGSWGQCSVSCGGGVQLRLVKCVDTITEREEEERERCDHQPWPENTQKCNLQECDSTSPGYVCLRDSLAFRFCQSLQWLGRCHLPPVRAQCCKTCGQRSRGDERTSRR
ncbi:A disintegrin and metalloproteinase with thrombospondin motifs 7 [Conger conger]|uniref:A disintegrin and metalloproteinase with thrombospondin motifs 7 n=1 Tax=Conger conger TaxID=82655 RepID=UPI002A5A8FC3|nr:A disintegrin and metalloproteinase with thrombospondin motifs 7 [Conger conger]